MQNSTIGQIPIEVLIAGFKMNGLDYHHVELQVELQGCDWGTDSLYETMCMYFLFKIWMCLSSPCVRCLWRKAYTLAQLHTCNRIIDFILTCCKLHPLSKLVYLFYSRHHYHKYMWCFENVTEMLYYISWTGVFLIALLYLSISQKTENIAKKS